MIINRNNYEAFFLDFHEGNLSDEGRREVLAFVKANPDLKEEFESFEMIFVESQSLKYPGKENLKKNPGISIHNYKTLLVAYMEGDLNRNKIAEVEKFLSENPAYGSELEILRKTKILPDYTIRFAGKASLKKGTVVIPMWVRYAAAACVVMGLLAYFFIQEKPSSQYAQEPSTEKRNAPSPLEPVKNPVAEIKAETPHLNEDKILHEEKPLQKKSVDLKQQQNLATNDTVLPVSEKIVPEPLIAENSDGHAVKPPAEQTTIIINEGISNDPAMDKMVVLDDDDLAELGLKEKQLPNSKLADAVNGVGKLFNVNAHYNKTQQMESKPTETWALGPLKIKRTVAR